MKDNITIVSKKKHLNYGFTTIINQNSNFENFKKHSHCPITYSELSHIASSYPIIFLKQDDNQFYMASLFSVLNDKNPFIDDLDESHQWLGEYVPVFFRFYPFFLVKTEDEKNNILCFLNNTPFVKTKKDDKSYPFFDEKGSLSIELDRILKILNIVEKESKSTKSAIQSLNDLELIKEWKVDVKLKGGEKKLMECIKLMRKS